MRVFLCALLLLSMPAAAGGVLDSTVSKEKGVYSLFISARIEAPAVVVHRLITDYNHLPEINPSIRESRIMRTWSPVRHRIHVITRVCVLFYCRNVTQVQDMLQHENYRLEAVILPELSDFRRGVASWRLTRLGEATLMEFSAELEPDFFVPPVIGPWLIRREMVNEIAAIVGIIENLAGPYRGT